MRAGTPWLDDREQVAWRALLGLSAALPAALNRQLMAESDLSLQDFDVLVALTDVASSRLRVSDLARAVHWERSRLSHHLTRMQRRGLVVREECADDGRGAYVALTDVGRDAIQGAAPGHVRAVRRLVFDHLSGADVQALAAITTRLLASVQAAADPADPAAGRPRSRPGAGERLGEGDADAPHHPV